MSVIGCPRCGTRCAPGVTCPHCGTPVPGESAAPELAGHGAYWNSILQRLKEATAPKYEVLSLLGYGGMAGVFAANEPRLGRKVALKVMSPALMMDPKLVERFVQEARTIALLSHPHIITIYEVDERADLHWFAMAMVGGRTLAQVVDETAEPLPIPIVRAWLYQIGDALAYAHRNGVIHRDVKPANVLLDLRGDAFVTDFGIAKVADADAGLTATGMVVGTPTYMSPEQCSSGAVTGASDQYALGALVYQMLAGQPLFTGPTLTVLRAHLAEAPRPLLELRPDCPEELAAATHRMLEKRPRDRWPSLSAAVAAAGATPPGFEDPVRAQMEHLATPAASLRISPLPAMLREGTRHRLEVAIEDTSGRALTGRRLHWWSSRSVVAAVADDTLLALSPGTAELMAATDSIRAGFSVTVEADVVAEVEVSGGEVMLEAGANARIEANVYALDGSKIEGRAMLWSTSDPEIARVTPDGTIAGISPGRVAISARTGERYAVATATVTAATVDPASISGVTPALPSKLPGASAPPLATAPGLARPTPRGNRVALAAVAVLILAVGAMALFQPSRGTGADAPLSGLAVTMVGPEAADPNELDGERNAFAELEPAGAGPTIDEAPITVASPSGTTVAAVAPSLAGTQPGPPPAASDGSISIAGQLPPGAMVTATDAAGRPRVLSADPAALAPGSYTLEFIAPGYELDRGTVVVRAGQAEVWTPAIRSLPSQPPARTPSAANDTRADQQAIESAVAAFVAAFGRRDAATVLPLMPPADRATWQVLLESRAVTDFSAALGEVSSTMVNGDDGTVRFTVNVSFRNQNQNQRSILPFLGHAERVSTGWRLVSLSGISDR